MYSPMQHPAVMTPLLLLLMRLGQLLSAKLTRAWSTAVRATTNDDRRGMITMLSLCRKGEWK